MVDLADPSPVERVANTIFMTYGEELSIDEETGISFTVAR